MLIRLQEPHNVACLSIYLNAWYVRSILALLALANAIKDADWIEVLEQQKWRTES